MDLLSRRQLGTGKWFLESGMFAQWRKDPKGRLLCVGMPGAGKTYLVASVIEELRKSLDLENNCVTYVFCNHKEQMDAANMHPVASVLKQLVQNRPSTAEPLTELHDRYKKFRTYPQLGEIIDSLKLVIQYYANVH